MAKAKFSSAYEKLRELLVKARLDAGLKQADVARALGVPQSYVSKVESGERRLDVVEFIAIAEAAKADPIKIVRAVREIRAAAERRG
jgi:transcriptional regulator with XRE-family HTH domain